jgi:hypothetical protein
VPGFDYLILVEWFPLKANNKSLAPTPLPAVDDEPVNELSIRS